MAANNEAIANLAVARLGDEATISALTPPEGSAQAEHCAMFLPIARRSLLEMFPWDFATKSVTLALQTETIRGWTYAYEKPSECVKVHAVLPPGAADDYSIDAGQRGTLQTSDGTIFLPTPGGMYMPQKFKTETSNATGKQLILTHQAEAEAICTFDVTDPTKFSPLFDDTLAWLLASHVAGPIYKGKSGVDMSNAMLAKFELFFGRATTSNASQEFSNVQHVPSHLSGRG